MRWLAPCEPWRLHLTTAHHEAVDVVIMLDDGIHVRYAPGNETNQHHQPFITHKDTSNTVMPGSLPALGPAPWNTLPCPAAELMHRAALTVNP